MAGNRSTQIAGASIGSTLVTDSAAEVMGRAPVGKRRHGLRVQIPSGEIGVVDRIELADGYVNPEDWPAIGSVITVLGAGCCGRQLRLSTRPSHIELARRRMTSAGSAGSIEPEIAASDD